MSSFRTKESRSLEPASGPPTCPSMRCTAEGRVLFDRAGSAQQLDCAHSGPDRRRREETQDAAFESESPRAAPGTARAPGPARAPPGPAARGQRGIMTRRDGGSRTRSPMLYTGPQKRDSTSHTHRLKPQQRLCLPTATGPRPRRHTSDSPRRVAGPKRELMRDAPLAGRRACARSIFRATIRWITPSPQFIKNAMKVATKAGRALICPPSTNTDCVGAKGGGGRRAGARAPARGCARSNCVSEKNPKRSWLRPAPRQCRRA